MVKYINTGIPWDNPDCQITFNPVSVNNTPNGHKIFNNLLKTTHKNVFTEYLDYIQDENPKRLLGDIQLVKLKDQQRFILNGYVYQKGKLDYLALSKTFVELFNIAEEYKLDVAIPLQMGSSNPFTKAQVQVIIDTVFFDFRQTAYIYNKIPSKIKK